MNTQIAEIECVNCDLRIAQFYNKKWGGLHLEMGPTNTVKIAMLTKKQVQELVKELQNWLGENELPFDRGYRKGQADFKAGYNTISDDY